MAATVYWSPGMSLAVLEQCVITQAMKHYGNNKTAVANSLGISIRTLDARLEKYELDDLERAAAHADRQQQRDELLRRSRGFHPSSLAVTSGLSPVVQVGTQAEAGVFSQPIANAPGQPSVPVSVGKKV